MTLRAWMKTQPLFEIAYALQVTTDTARKWRLGYKLPVYYLLHRLWEMSGRRFDLNATFEEFFSRDNIHRDVGAHEKRLA